MLSVNEVEFPEIRKKFADADPEGMEKFTKRVNYN